jgi:hypothetical protein
MKSWKDKYSWVDIFKEGRARVRRNGIYGIVDVVGNEVIPLKYDWIGDFTEGRAGVGHNMKYGFVDMDGNEVVPLKYDSVSVFKEVEKIS